MNNIDLMNYWINSSDNDYEVMLDLKEKKRNTYCLFFGQLLIEKLLKAYYAKINKNAPHAPKSHDLLYLAEKMNLELSDEQKILLDTISDFNMSARYDDYKNNFAAKCTDDFTEKQLKNIEGVRTWLKTLLMEEKKEETTESSTQK